MSATYTRIKFVSSAPFKRTYFAGEAATFVAGQEGGVRLIGPRDGGADRLVEGLGAGGEERDEGGMAAAVAQRLLQVAAVGRQAGKEPT